MSEQAPGLRRELEAQLIARAWKDDAFKEELMRNPQAETLARPLGVRPDLPLTDTQSTRLQRLQDYDLAPVRARLLKAGVLPAERVDDAIFEFRRFLGLRIVGYRGLLMVSRAVDEVWHTCLLFSRLYADLCEQTVGQFVHHEPLMGETGDGPSALDGMRTFEKAYTRVYGETTTLQAILELTDEQVAGVVGGGGKAGSLMS